MQLTNLYFLPQNDSSILTNIEAKLNALEIMLFFSLMTIKALKIFMYEKKMLYFDPHVGDTCCQIRAYKVFLVSKKPTIEYQYYLKNIDTMVERLKTKIFFLKNLAADQRMADKEMIHKGQKLYTFFSSYGLVFSIPDDIFFLTTSFFLTHFKSTDTWGNTYINIEAVEKQIGVSRKLAKKIVRDQQLKLANDSISFIESLQKSLVNDPLSSFDFSHLIKNDDNDRKVLPCYLIMKFLFNHMVKENAPLLLVINRYVKNQHFDTIYIIFFDTFNYIHLRENSLLDYAEAYSTAVVIEGLVEYMNEENLEAQEEYIERLLQVGLETLIFTNMAYHPQYSGEKLAHLSSKPFNQGVSIEPGIKDDKEVKKEKIISHELMRMQQLAIDIGCCDANRSLFFIRHVYCDRIDNLNEQLTEVNYHEPTPYAILPLSIQQPYLNI